jgi:hypothetical protein
MNYNVFNHVMLYSVIGLNSFVYIYIIINLKINVHIFQLLQKYTL